MALRARFSDGGGLRRSQSESLEESRQALRKFFKSRADIKNLSPLKSFLVAGVSATGGGKRGFTATGAGLGAAIGFTTG